MLRKEIGPFEVLVTAYSYSHKVSNGQHVLYSVDSLKVCSSDAFIVHVPFSEVHLIYQLHRKWLYVD